MKITVCISAILAAVSVSESAKLRNSVQMELQRASSSPSCEESAASLIMTAGGKACSGNESAILSDFFCSMQNGAFLRQSSQLTILSTVGQAATCAQAVYNNIVPTLFYKKGVPCADAILLVFNIFFNYACPDQIARQVNFLYCNEIYKNPSPRIPTLEDIENVAAKSLKARSKPSVCLITAGAALAEFAEPFKPQGAKKCYEIAYDRIYGKVPNCPEKGLAKLLENLCEYPNFLALTVAEPPVTEDILSSAMEALDQMKPSKSQDMHDCVADMRDYITATQTGGQGGNLFDMQECVSIVREYVAGYASGCKDNSELSDAFANSSCKVAKADLMWIAEKFDVEKVKSKMIEDYPSFSEEDISTCVESGSSMSGNVFSR